VLPVWVLLQPRDFVNSLLLYLGMALMYAGFFVQGPEFVAPAFSPAPVGAPPMLPFVFVVIACGAVSGFHGLVSSGTTAKQLDRAGDARMIGYGGMIGESLLGLMAVLACTAGFSSSGQWHLHYADWGSANTLGGKIGVFIEGSAGFVSSLGVPAELATAFIAVVAGMVSPAWPSALSEQASDSTAAKNLWRRKVVNCTGRCCPSAAACQARGKPGLKQAEQQSGFQT